MLKKKLVNQQVRTKYFLFLTEIFFMWEENLDSGYIMLMKKAAYYSVILLRAKVQIIVGSK